ncbi:FAD/FMN-containing dehydrogenase [Streptomyces olivoverticillatus]|uniref:FAD/FMN-containing dehydrogenase n=1 Tax=Streptomyces olivoverticillatus TaxID=66427 RepID=A0A7W7LKR5_9ACTN|nr:FAD-binding oxidoreductase [Streptomyces olivoverticillatus]MBB4892059.1 FAD/FMN-containing dehydrogenase [Streptomyces olivoverticillatus]
MVITRRGLLAAGTGVAAGGVWAVACAGGTGHAAPGRSSGASRASKAAAADWTALGKGLGGGLIRPDDADYTAARRLYNTRFDQLRPAGIAYVKGTGDIAACLSFARRFSIPVAIRNGGHSYAGWSSGNDRLVIDVSRLKTVRTTSATTAVIGAGAKLIDVYSGLASHGVTIPGGSCPTVGVSGLTLGGGHGILSRAYGLTCDSLTGATLVTADGKTVICDSSHNSDLFWALRGAGNGNFGVVTELSFRTHAVAGGVTGYVSFPWAKAAAVIRAWQEWGPGCPDEIWSACDLSAAAGGTPHISVAAFSIGSYGDLENALGRLVDKVGKAGGSSGTPRLRRHTYLDTVRAYAGCDDKSTEQCHLPGRTPGRESSGKLDRETYVARSDFFDRSLDSSGIRTLLDQLERFGRKGGSGGASVQLTALGGAVNRVGTLDTAFVHRKSRFLAQYLTSWAAGGSGATQTSWLDGAQSAMRRYASGAAYQNYTDPTLKDWRKAYYGDAADRLAKIKRQYDPGRLFDFPQAL